MEPRIQYAQTKDGVSIAFYTLGEGMPLLHMPPGPLSHLQLERQWFELGGWFEHLSEKRMLIRYDGRGTGLSDRDVGDFEPDAPMLDLEAILDRLDLDEFVLLGPWSSGVTAIAYAVRCPERVSRLVLWCTYAPGSDPAPPAFRALGQVADKDWNLYTESLAQAISRWVQPEQARQFARFTRECTTPETWERYVRALETANEFYATGLLPQVAVPTLVLQPREMVVPDVSAARGLASQIPNARLVVVEGGSPYFQTREQLESTAQAIDEFLGEGEEAPAVPELPEGMAVLLFADIAESTALTEKLGDAAFRAKARKLDTSLRSVIKDSGGTPVEGKVLGDGVLAVFTSARQAIDCALRCEAVSQPLGLRLHLGIHAGDVIREGNNVYGGAVNIAARVASASAPGEILVSDIVRGLARTSAGVAFDDRGEHTLKGVGEPQRLFAVRGGG
jgi:class 3 adenylate cyclase